MDLETTEARYTLRRMPLAWVRTQMTEVLRQWRAAETLRGQRRRKTWQALTRWAAALLVAGGLAWPALTPVAAYAPSMGK